MSGRNYVAELAKAMPPGWGVTKSRWLKPGPTITYDNSPFEHHPPQLAENIVTGVYSHPLAEDVGSLKIGGSVSLTTKQIMRLGRSGVEFVQACIFWAARNIEIVMYYEADTYHFVIQRVEPDQ